MVLEKILESPLDSKEINPKENQPCTFIGRTNAKAGVPVLWLPDAKSQLDGKTPMLGKTEGKRRMGQQRMRCITNSMDMNLNKLQGIVKDREAWHASIHGVAKSWVDLVTEQQQHLPEHPPCIRNPSKSWRCSGNKLIA